MADKVNIKSMELTLLIEEVCQEIRYRILYSMKPELDGLEDTVEHTMLIKRLVEDTKKLIITSSHRSEIRKEKEVVANVGECSYVHQDVRENSKTGGSQQQRSAGKSLEDNVSVKIHSAFLEFKCILVQSADIKEVEDHLGKGRGKECRLMLELDKTIDPGDSTSFVREYTQYQDLKTQLTGINIAADAFNKELKSWVGVYDGEEDQGINLKLTRHMEQVYQQMRDRLHSLKPELDGLRISLENYLLRIKGLADDLNKLMIISSEGGNSKENKELASVGVDSTDKSYGPNIPSIVQSAFLEFKRLLMVKCRGMKDDDALYAHLLQLWKKECDLMGVLDQVIDPSDIATSETFMDRYFKFQTLKSKLHQQKIAQAECHQSWKDGLKSDSHDVGGGHCQLLIQEDGKLLCEKISHDTKDEKISHNTKEEKVSGCKRKGKFRKRSK